MWRWKLPWSLTRSLHMPCKGNEALPSRKEYSGSRREVTWLIEELFQPCTSWETILDTLGFPDEECFHYVFDIPSEEALESAKLYFSMLLGNLVYGVGTFLGAPWYEIENLQCITPNPATRYDWVPWNLKLRRGLTACSFSVGGVAVPSLVFAKGRWYLLPSPRLILTIQQPK